MTEKKRRVTVRWRGAMVCVIARLVYFFTLALVAFRFQTATVVGKTCSCDATRNA